ncbi:SET domain [Penicillium roqueforti FM164]|uniref:SET domain n=1 Tax=Penicillium roqueforti (strain FM164) TaxID=1365484 RepID=W6Q454_PENRF|nr:SET domain [Penicillium roqueforti FM164]
MSANRRSNPDDAPFELKPSPGKGWGAFATKRIERGSLILKEKALFVIQKSSVDITGLDVFRAVMELSPTELVQSLLIQNNESEEPKGLLETLSENYFTSALKSIGFYTLGSRFNHSCIPNARVPSDPRPFIELLATKKIEAGEEIYFCYFPDLKAQTRHERHESLGFVCSCKALDLDGQRQSSQSTLIVDPKLKAAAETGNIPLMSRMVLHLLMVVFLEEEGLLDDWAVKVVEQGAVTPVFWCQSEYNYEIADLALAQDTWLEKLQVAFQIYGRTDPADQMIARMIQQASQKYAAGQAMPPWT